MTHYGMTWPQFRQAFDLAYGDTFVSLQARSKAILQTQTRGESLVAFATRKINVLRQYQPGMSTAEILEVVTSTALPAYRGGLAPLIHGTTREFMKSAMLMDGHAPLETFSRELERRQRPQDEERYRPHPMEERSRPPAPRRDDPPRGNRPPPREGNPPDGRREWDRTQPPPYACRYCPGELYHWHNECPNAPGPRGRGGPAANPAGNGGRG